jgi:serine/threonine protein kinase
MFFSLISEIKGAEYTIPDDGRVSEDTKSLIRKLLITNPKERMTSIQVKDALESIIAMWRSISAPASDLQLVPELSLEEAKARAEAEKTAKLESAHTDLFLNLMQQNHKTTELQHNASSASNHHHRVGGHHSLTSASPIKVTRLSSDARPLTAEEYRQFGSLVTKLRQTESTKATSTTGRPILPSAASALEDASSSGSEQLLLSSRSQLLAASYRRSQQPLAPPIPAEPAAVPVPVIEQESVLDLSVTPQNGTRRNSN